MLHRIKKKNDANHDKWIGIGGKFEPYETPEMCMLREVEEETGLKLISWTYRGIIQFLSDEWPDEEMHLFTSSEYSGSLKECSEGHLEWVLKEDVTNLPVWAGDKIFLSLLQTDHPFFNLELKYQGEQLVSAVLDGQSVSY